MSKTEGEFSLEEQLEALEGDGKWDVLKTFKQTKSELTQKVVRRSDGEKSQAFVRKEFSEDSKQGTAYEQLWQEKWKGRVLKHCPKIQDWYEYGRTKVVILDFIEGETLEEYVRNNALTNLETKELFLKICEAVQELHSTFEQPLIHRDLKPTNIIVSEGDVKIIDFGIARFQRGGLTPDTTQFGTPAFAPPEQYGFGETSVESDVYALGMVFYFMFTKKLSKVPLRDNLTFSEEIPLEFQSILLKATAFDPQDRFSSVKELKEALTDLMRDLKLEKSENPSWLLTGGEESDTSVCSNAGVNTDTESGHSQRVNNILKTLKDKVGLVWNVFILAVWLLSIVSVIGIIVSPNGEATKHSLLYRIVSYVGVIGIPFTLWGFVLLDKTRLKEKFPILKTLTWKWLLLLALAGLIIMVAAALLSNVL